jgi:CheY-like chemotaxis protein
MGQILVVDDDALILSIYGRRLNQEGYTVETASDGLAAVKSLHTSRPSLVVLDLMMPKISGVEVLKFIRTDPALKATPVVLLSNSFMGDLLEEATKLGVQGALIKARCTPADLTALVKQALNNKAASPAPSPTETAAAKARRDFVERAPETLTKLRTLCSAFVRATDAAARKPRLEEFYSQARQITALAGFADQHAITLLAGAFEALLHELLAKPAAINPSTLRTITASIDLLAVLCERERDRGEGPEVPAKILAVDDDPLSTRIITEALARSHLSCTPTQDPVLALKWLAETRYNLVLLDIAMPGLDGFELCKQLRKIPGYAKTPVVYVTGHNDFESRAKSILSGGDDLISKPIFPMELTLKAVTHLLRGRLDSKPAKG